MSTTTEALNRYHEQLYARVADRVTQALGLRDAQGHVLKKHTQLLHQAEEFSAKNPAAYAAWRKAGGGILRSYQTSERRYADPTVTDVHVDAVLTGMSVQYRNETYIADQVFPILPVRKESDVFFSYDKSDWLRDEAAVRAAGASAAEGGYTLSTSGYAATEKAFKTRIPWRVRDNADNPLDVDRDAVDFVTEKLLIRRERIVASILTSISNVGSGATPTNKWSNFTTSDPISDVRTGRAFIKQMTGRSPNTLIVGWEVAETLVDHPNIIERIKYTERGDVRAALNALAAIFNVERVLIGEAVYETAAHGGTSSLSYIWGQNAVLAYVNPRPALRAVTGGLTFATVPRRIRRGVNTENKYDWVEAEEITDSKVIVKEAIYTLTNVL